MNRCIAIFLQNRNVLALFLFAISLLSIAQITAFENNSKEDNIIFIDSEVIQKIESQGQADVIIRLKDFSNLDYSSAKTKQEKLEIYRDRGKINSDFQSQVLSTLTDSDFLIKRTSLVGRWFSGIMTENGLNRLKMNPYILEISIDELIFGGLDDTVPLINGDDLRNKYSLTGLGQTVCVIDSGVDYTHPALEGCTEEQLLAGGCEKVPYGHILLIITTIRWMI